GFQGGPFGASFFQVKDVVLGVGEAEQVILLFFLDGEVATDREVNDGGSDVAHVHGVVDEGADFGGGQVVGRFVLRGDGAEARVAAAGPPPPEHEEKGDDGNEERPVAAEDARKDGKSSGFAHRAFVEGDGDGEAFVEGEGGAGLHVHAAAGDFDFRFMAGGAVGSCEGLCAEIFGV